MVCNYVLCHHMRGFFCFCLFARMCQVTFKLVGSELLSLLLFTGETQRSGTQTLQTPRGFLHLMLTRHTCSKINRAVQMSIRFLFLKQVTCASKHPTLINQQHRNESPDSELVSMVITALRAFVSPYL